MQRYILLSVEAKYYNVMPKINVDKKQQKVTCTSISPLLVVTTVVLYILHYKQANTSTHTHINILTYYIYNILFGVQFSVVYYVSNMYHLFYTSECS